MFKTVTLCKELMSEICDKITDSLNECAEKTLSEELVNLVEITTRNYQELLLKIMFDEEGEDDGKGVT